MPAANKNQKTIENPGVLVGDSVYYKHPDHGVCHGHVVAVGKHGFQADAEEGRHKIQFCDYLGHRARVARNLKVADHGEDGAIMTDENGQRVFVHGYGGDDEAGKEKLAKASVVSLPVLPPGDSVLEKAQVVAELAKAGFEPMMDYVHRTFGEHYVYKPAALDVPAPSPDAGEVLTKALSGMRADQERLVKGLTDMVGDLSSQLAAATDLNKALLTSLAEVIGRPAPELKIPDGLVRIEPAMIQVDVHVPEQAPAPVTVNVPEQKAPVVNVPAAAAPVVKIENKVQPAGVTVVSSGPRRSVQTVERNRDDEILRTVTTHEYGER